MRALQSIQARCRAEPERWCRGTRPAAASPAPSARPWTMSRCGSLFQSLPGIEKAVIFGDGLESLHGFGNR